jgi:hypothetical protein
VKRHGKCGRKVNSIVNKGNNKITELRMIWRLWKKSQLNSEKIWKIEKKIGKR